MAKNDKKTANTQANDSQANNSQTKDEKNGATGPNVSSATPKNTGENTEKSGQGSFRMQSQYITDLSFECPQPPAHLGKYQNNMKMDVGVQSRPLPNPQDPTSDDAQSSSKAGAESHEVTLTLRGHNKTEDGKTVYLLEMKFSGLFVLEDIPRTHTGSLLGVEAPALLYPFARQLFMSTVAGSGFQPPLLEPINFAAIYMQQQQQNTDQPTQQQAAN